MFLQTNPNLRILQNNERIPKDAKCYGRMASGVVGWCNPGELKGKKWEKHSINSPSIIMTERPVGKG